MKIDLPPSPTDCFLIGILIGFNSDDKFSDKEAATFLGLLNENPSLIQSPVMARYLDHLAKIKKREFVTRAEYAILKEVMAHIIGASRPPDFTEKKELVFDQVEKIYFLGPRLFVLTGIFAEGKQFIDDLILQNGGLCMDSVTTNVEYVIVGDTPDPAWRFGNYGTKVKKAMELKEKGYDIKIIQESLFKKIIGRTE